MTSQQSGSGTHHQGAGGLSSGKRRSRRKWIFITLGILLGAFVIFQLMAKKDTAEKVATEKATKRTIVETVNASGKIFPSVELRIRPNNSGKISELHVAEDDSVKKGQLLARIYADIYALQRDEAASRVNQSSATVDNSSAALDALKANLEQAQQSYDRNR